MADMNYITLFNVEYHRFKNTRHYEVRSGYPFIGFGILTAGKAVFTAHDGTQIKVDTGEAIYIPKGQIYVSDWEGSPDISFYSVSIDYPNTSNGSHYYPLQKVIVDKEIVDTVSEMYSLIQNGGDDRYLALGKFYGIYSKITGSLSSARYKKSYIEILKAVSYIEQNCTFNFSVESLAKMCNMSESKFYAAFKNGTGFSPTEYKNHIRIMRAEQMLAQNPCSIEYICEQLNFCSPAYFRRVFKQHTHMLPSEVKAKPNSL